MKCQILFSRKKKKKCFKMTSAENFTQSAISVKILMAENLNKSTLIPSYASKNCGMSGKQCKP